MTPFWIFDFRFSILRSRRKKISCFVLVALLVALGGSAGAQSRGDMPKIGVLFSQASRMESFLRGLRELGYIPGQNVTILHLNPGASEERYPQLAAELVSQRVDLIVVGGLTGARAAQKATKSIPIVIAAAAIQSVPVLWPAYRGLAET